MNITSVNTINENLELFQDKFVYVKCYIMFNQDFRMIHHVSTPEQPAYPAYDNTSAIEFDYRGILDFSHSDLKKIDSDRTIVVVGGTIVPYGVGEDHSYPSKIIATELRQYEE